MPGLEPGAVHTAVKRSPVTILDNLPVVSVPFVRSGSRGPETANGVLSVTQRSWKENPPGSSTLLLGPSPATWVPPSKPPHPPPPLHGALSILAASLSISPSSSIVLSLSLTDGQSWDPPRWDWGSAQSRGLALLWLFPRCPASISRMIAGSLMDLSSISHLISPTGTFCSKAAARLADGSDKGTGWEQAPELSAPACLFCSCRLRAALAASGAQPGSIFACGRRPLF